MPKFDFDGAREAGYSEDEIVGFLKEKGAKFDFDGAQEAGYSAPEILGFLEQNRDKIFPEKPGIATRALDNIRGMASIAKDELDGLFGTGKSTAETIAARPPAPPEKIQQAVARRGEAAMMRPEFYEDLRRLTVENPEQAAARAKVKDFTGAALRNIIAKQAQQRPSFDQEGTLVPPRLPPRDLSQINERNEINDVKSYGPDSAWADVVGNSPAGMVASGKYAVAELGVMKERGREIEFSGVPDPENMDARDLQARAADASLPQPPGGSQAYLERMYGKEGALKIARDALDEAKRSGEAFKAKAAEAKKEMELVTPKGTMSTAQKAFWSTVVSLPPTALGISVGIATRNPFLAMAIAGGGGSLQQAGSTYGEATEKGASHRMSRTAAVIDGILEGVGESLPLAVALKPGSKIYVRLLNTMAAEAGQEAATQAMQDLNAYLSYNPKITLKEAIENVKVAALAGAMGGSIWGTVGHAQELDADRQHNKAYAERVKRAAGIDLTQIPDDQFKETLPKIEEVAKRLPKDGDLQKAAQAFRDEAARRAQPVPAAEVLGTPEEGAGAATEAAGEPAAAAPTTAPTGEPAAAPAAQEVSLDTHSQPEDVEREHAERERVAAAQRDAEAARLAQEVEKHQGQAARAPDLAKATDQMLAYLSERGAGETKAAAAAEIERRAGARGAFAAELHGAQPAATGGTAPTGTSDPKSAFARLAAVHAKRGVQMTHLEGDAVPKTHSRTAALFKAAFGKNVVFVSSPQKNEKGDYLYEGSMFEDDPSTVFVNTHSKRSWRRVIGHEIMHSLKRSNRAVYNNLVQSIAGLVKTMPAAEVYTRAYGDKPTAIQVEEMVSDMHGDLMDDPLFWLQVFRASKQPVVKKLKHSMSMLFDVMRMKLRLGEKRSGFGSSNLISDIEGARRAFAKAYAEWQANPSEPQIQQQQKGQQELALESKPDGRGGSIPWTAKELQQRVAERAAGMQGQVAIWKAQGRYKFDKGDLLLSKSGKTWKVLSQFIIREGGMRYGRDVPGYVMEHGTPNEGGWMKSTAYAEPWTGIGGAKYPGAHQTMTKISKEGLESKPGSRELPEIEGKTGRDVWNLVQRMEAMAREGEAHKDWYEDSAKEMLRAFNGDKNAAKIFAQVIAITSANTEVKANFTQADKALFQYAQGKAISVGTQSVDDKLNDLLYFGVPWEGRKTNVFYTNLIEAIDGKRPSETTQDMHMGMIGLGKKKLTDAEYTFMDAVTKLVAERLGWTPQQTQAAAWVTQKARSLLERYEDFGFHADKSPQAKRHMALTDAGINYGDLIRTRGWFWPAESMTLPKAREVRSRGRQVTAEVIPSKKLAIGQAVANLSMAKLQAYTRDAIDKVFGVRGVDSLMQEMGLDRSKYRVIEGAGGYDAALAPNQIITLNVEPEMATRVAKAWMYIFRQDAVPFFRTDAKLREDRNAAQAVQIRFAENLSNPLLRKVFDSLRDQVHPAIGITKFGRNVIAIINFRGEDGQPFLMPDPEFVEKIAAAVKGNSLGVKISGYGRFGAETAYPYHDWEAEPDGAGLHAAASGGRPDLHEWLRRRADAFGRYAEKRGGRLAQLESKPGSREEVGALTDALAHRAATSEENDKAEPTEAQKAAGNYPKGHVRVAGLDITIENPEGSTRTWKRANGTTGETVMKAHYGYIKGTEGADGDHLDVFVKPGTPTDYAGPVFVVDQTKMSSGRFDEHKVMLGWTSMPDAIAAYKENYQRGWDGLEGSSRFDTPKDFKAFLDTGDLTKRAAEQSLYSLPWSREKVVAKPGVDFGRLNALLGAKLYGDPTNLPQVSVKEMVQNAFDAVRNQIRSGKIDRGHIDITFDPNKRVITVEDDGTGMTASVLSNQFLQLAGTAKEGDKNSGGLGIAKGLFLYGNKHIRVETIRDGVLSILDTTGEKLIAAAAGGAQVNVTTEKTSQPNGTKISVKIPEDYVEASTGEKRSIWMPYGMGGHGVLNNSPLFSPIEVTFNGEAVPDMGQNFPVNDFSNFATVKFRWGTARIYVSKKERKIDGSNVHVLSNGLWQFSTSLNKNPFELFGERIPRLIYVDVEPKVKAEDSGYPFDLNRQGFTKQVKDDMAAVMSYVSLAYQLEKMSGNAESHGSVQYLSKDGPEEPITLAPKITDAQRSGMLRVVEGDKVEIDDGVLKVNGRVVPILTPQELKSAKISLSDFQIPQKQIRANQPMMHNNMVENLGPDDIDGTVPKTFPEVMRDKFGKRFDEAMWEFGRIFRDVRDSVVKSMIETYGARGRTPEEKMYSGLNNVAVGVSFDTKYAGLHFTTPFRGMYINPAVKPNSPHAGIPGFVERYHYASMVHEIAHFAEMNHNAEFVQALEDVNNVLALNGTEARALRHLKDLMALHGDIFTFMQTELTNANYVPIGKRLEGGDKSTFGGSEAGSVASTGVGGRSGRGVLDGAQARNSGRAQGEDRGGVPEEGSLESKPEDRDAYEEELDAINEELGRTDPLQNLEDYLPGGATNITDAQMAEMSGITREVAERIADRNVRQMLMEPEVIPIEDVDRYLDAKMKGDPRITGRANSRTLRIEWAEKPQKGNWVSLTADGRYEIRVADTGYYVVVDNVERQFFKNRRDAIAKANAILKEEVANKVIPHPNPGTVLNQYTPEQIRRVAAGWKKLASIPALFRYKSSDSKKLYQIAEDMEMMGKIKRIDAEEFRTDDYGMETSEIGWVEFMIHFANETFAKVSYAPKRATAYIDAQDLIKGSQMGSRLYQLILTWAHNNDVKVIPDPGGLTGVNTFRRTEQMLSSALRFGTTKHMRPHPDQGLVGWNDKPVTKEDNDKNIALMALKSMQSTFKHAQTDRVKYMEYNFDERRFKYADDFGKHKAGDPVTTEDLADAVKDQRTRELFGIGKTTIARAIFTHSLVYNDEGAQRLVDGKVTPGMILSGPSVEDNLQLYSQPGDRFDAPKPGLVKRATLATAKGATMVAQPISTVADVANATADTVAKIAGKPLAMVTSRIYDRLMQVGERFFKGGEIRQQIAHGLVSDYGLPEPYTDRRDERDIDIQKHLRKSKAVIDRIAALDDAESMVAYQWMQEKPNAAEEQRLLNLLPEGSRQALAQMKEQIRSLGREAMELGLISEETLLRNEMAYLHRSYKKYEVENPQAVAASARAKSIKADSFKGRGMRDDVDAARLPAVQRGDHYVRLELRGSNPNGLGPLRRVVYLSVGTPIPAAYAGWRNDGVWEARFMDKPGQVGLWRDFTPEERERMGEIREVRYAFARTMIGLVHDVETAKFLKWVADTYSVADEEAVHAAGGRVADAVDNAFTLKTYADDEWVQVPGSMAQGTRIYKYGLLQSRYVPGHIWNDIRSTINVRSSSAVWRLYDQLLTAWKVSKTALSPAVHTNNIMANFVFMDVADVKTKHLVRSLQTLIDAERGNEEARILLTRYLDSGAELGTPALHELKKEIIEPLLSKLQGQENDDLAQVSLIQAVSLAAHGNVRQAWAALAARKSSRLATAPFRAMLAAYQLEDSVFRFATWLKEIDEGKSDRQAGNDARKQFLDYRINAPWIQALRKGPFPFLAFTYRAVPIMAEAFAKKPWKMMKYAAVGYALNALSYAMLGLGPDDEKRERRLLPEEKTGHTIIGTPRLVRMPWNDDQGQPVFLDIRRWIPGGDIFDINGSHGAIPMPQWLSFGGFWGLAIEMASNKSQFTGKEIWKETDNLGEKAAKVVDHVFKYFVPNLPFPNPLGYAMDAAVVEKGMLQTYSWKAIQGAGSGSTDDFGRERSLPQALASAVGVKLASYPHDQLQRNLRAQRDAQLRDLNENTSRYRREYRRGGLTQEEFADRMSKQGEKRAKINKEFGEKVGGNDGLEPIGGR